ncbi:MAG: hypothetical protein RR543_02615 [Erysipelotrichales bacterium]
MNKFFKSIRNIKYPIIIIISIILFVTGLTLHRDFINSSYDNFTTRFFLIILLYAFAIIIGILWGFLNYMSNGNDIKLKYDSVADYVGALNASDDEKYIISEYINEQLEGLKKEDYNNEDSLLYAINNFEQSKLFHLRYHSEDSSHSYLLVLSLFTFVIGVIAFILRYNKIMIGTRSLQLTIGLTSFVYLIAFLGLYFIFYISNKLIFKQRK